MRKIALFRPETEQLEAAILPLIEAHNAYLIELKFNRSKYGSVVEVFIDTETGVSSELCADLSHEFSPVLEGFEFLQGRYDLIVSSPGLDRPLKFPKQYPKHKGHTMAIKHTVNDKPVVTTGVLVDANDAGITLKLEDGENKEFSFNEILEAKVKPKW